MSYEHDHENEVNYFARTNFRNQLRKFGVKTDDRRRHVYVIGKTGMGKTVLLENLILTDIYAGHGCAYIDPHGDTAERLVDYIPSWRINDVIYFNPADLDFPIGFNILETTSEKTKHLVASGMMGVFKKLWENLWSARMEYILNNAILALLDNPGSTLLGINRMLSDADFRRKIVANVQDPIVKQFWLVEFASYQEKYAQEAVAPIQNKIGQFLSASVIRNIVAQVKSTINIRQLMDEQKILIINLSKGRIGEDNMRLLGGLLITKLQLSAMERVDQAEHERKDFYMYVDEFQNFATESFAGILSEARKYRLCLTMAHQYIAQLSDEVREAVFGNVGTIITFRVGSPDAAYMETEFAPRFLPEDIINLPKYNVYLKLLIDGVTSQPFSAMTLPPIAKRTGSEEKVIKVSRERYTTPREEIADKIMKWTGMGDDESIGKMVSDMEAKKTAAKGAKKPRFDYKCSRCNKDIALAVQLDTSRPIYCEECIEIVKDERAKGKDRKDTRRPPSPPPPPISQDRPEATRRAVVESIPVVAPKPAPSVSLTALAPVARPPAAQVARPPIVAATAKPVAQHVPPPNDFMSQMLSSPLNNPPIPQNRPEAASKGTVTPTAPIALAPTNSASGSHSAARSTQPSPTAAAETTGPRPFVPGKDTRRKRPNKGTGGPNSPQAFLQSPKPRPSAAAPQTTNNTNPHLQQPVATPSPAPASVPAPTPTPSVDRPAPAKAPINPPAPVVTTAPPIPQNRPEDTRRADDDNDGWVPLKSGTVYSGQTIKFD